MSEQPVGEVTHYFHKAGVAGITVLDGHLTVGDTVQFTGHTTEFRQVVDSMQIEHEAVQTVGPGDKVGIKVKDRVRVGDTVYRVSEE